MIKSDNSCWDRILVVFVDNTGLWYLKPLRRGFRHCAVVLGKGTDWVVIDNTAPYTNVSLIKFYDESEITAYFRAKGATVVEACMEDPPRVAQKIGIFTCVENVKRVLGIKRFWLITPFSLYKFLEKRNNRKKTIDIRIKA